MLGKQRKSTVQTYRAVPDSMNIRSADPSVVKAIRQRVLLTEWLRQHAAAGGLPSFAHYCPSDFDEEKRDMLMYEVADASASPRLVISYDGQRLSQAYNTVGKGRALQDVMGPKRAAAILPLYYACVQRRLPVYSVCAATDVNGTHVDFERLLLPFGKDGRVTDIVASLKTISLEGSFEQKQLLRADEAPVFSLIAAIDTNLALQRPARIAADDIVTV
jgi:hypothetical protein